MSRAPPSVGNRLPQPENIKKNAKCFGIFAFFSYLCTIKPISFTKMDDYPAEDYDS